MSNKDRFLNKPLRKNPDKKNYAFEVRRDDFGNRVFSSINFSFLNRHGESTTARILISPEGEKLIKSKRGLLGIIDVALNKIQNTFVEGTIATPIDSLQIDENTKLDFLTYGGQSRVYVLTLDGHKYIIKVRTAIDKSLGDVTQPYSNEMLQIQSTQEKLKIKGIFFPKILFASGQILVSEHIKGVEPSEEDVLKHAEDLEMIINFVKEQNNSLPQLWRGIFPDIINRQEKRVKTDNFLLTPDGKLYFVDPFYLYSVS